MQPFNPIFKDTKTVFENAIKLGYLNLNEGSELHAGNYMYMYSDSNSDYFKHSTTRQYLIIKG